MEPDFDLPHGIPEDDVLILQNVLVALQSLGGRDKPCLGSYKVKTVDSAYLIFATLPASDIFEIGLDDMLFVKSVSPARIQSIAFGRSASGGVCELVIRVVDCRQKLMVTSTVSFSSATRKRAWSCIEKLEDTT